MRRIASVCFFALLVATAASAQITGGGGSPDELKGNIIKGEVKKVDTEKNTLTLFVNGKDEEFKIPRTAKITVRVANETKVAQNGLNDPWFQSASKAAGTNRFHVQLLRKEDEIQRVHLLTPTGREEP
jgi:hypothetical protein